MPITNWEISNEEFDMLMLVVDRAIRDLNGYPDQPRTLIMDLMACHANGCPLDFSGLLAAPMLDFSHDIYGIRKAINRGTGKLTEDCFMPRYNKLNTVPDCAAAPTIWTLLTRDMDGTSQASFTSKASLYAALAERMIHDLDTDSKEWAKVLLDADRFDDLIDFLATDPPPHFSYSITESVVCVS